MRRMKVYEKALNIKESRQVVVVLVTALVAALATAACGDPEPTAPRTEAQPAFVDTHDPVALWTHNCALCHRTTELAGRGAADIRRALAEVESMRRFRLDDAQVDAIAALIAEENAGADAPSPASAPPAAMPRE
jgi:hypothetical protein